MAEELPAELGIEAARVRIGPLARQLARTPGAVITLTVDGVPACALVSLDVARRGQEEATST